MTTVPSHRLKQAKRALRRAVLAERNALPAPERAARSVVVSDRLLGLDETARATTVLVFWSFGSEVETAHLIDRLRALGKTVALPRIESGDLAPVGYVPGASMAETTFGAMEP